MAERRFPEIPGILRIVRWCATAIEALRNCSGKWRNSEDGVAAVEFALFASAVLPVLVWAADLGLAEYERMTIDHILRAGAQSAIADQGQDQVLKVVQNTASKNFTLSTQASSGTLKVDVKRFCACPENTSAEVACSTTCAGSAPTFIYYRLTGEKNYKAIIIPQVITLKPVVEVQTR
jgi:pilus assembly protein CpaE